MPIRRLIFKVDLSQTDVIILNHVEAYGVASYINTALQQRVNFLTEKGLIHNGKITVLGMKARAAYFAEKYGANRCLKK